MNDRIWVGEYMRLTFWRFQLILLVLYFFWGNFFTGGGLISQIVYNFAVFYPVGFLEGYWPAPSGKWTVLAAAMVFNVMSYLVAVLAAMVLPGWPIVVIDYVSMAAFILIGKWMGHRLAQK